MIVGWIGLFCVSLLKKSFIKNEEGLKDSLAQLGFSFEIIQTPAILFEESIEFRLDKTQEILFKYLGYSFFVLVLFKVVKCGAFNHSIFKKKLNEKGIVSDYSRNMSLILSDNDSLFVEYVIPKSEDTFNGCRIAVYTVLTGDYDNVHNPLYKSSNADYYMFTNNRNLVSDKWRIVYLDSELSDLMLSRDVRMHPKKYLPDYDFAIYVDASFLLYGDLTQMIKCLNDNVDFVLTKHSARKTVKEEFDAYVHRFALNQQDAENQYQKYIGWGFKDDLGLSENGLLVMRLSSDSLMNLLDKWYIEFRDEPIKRDQISLMPCIYKAGFQRYKLINGSVWRNQFFRVLNHK